MDEAKRLLLEDAIETAIKSEKTVIRQRRVICGLVAGLIASLIMGGLHG